VALAGVGIPGVAAGVATGVKPAIAFGAGVEGVLKASCSGLGFIFVIKKDIFAPE
jgi:predicted transcriptional regulator